MKLDIDEAKVIQDLVTRVSKCCGVTYKEDQNCVYIRHGDWQVRLSISEIDTPAALVARIKANDEREERMDELSDKLEKLGVNLDAELYRVENNCYPK